MATVYEQDHPFTNSFEIQQEFSTYLRETPNKIRISNEDKWKIIGWLNGPVNQMPEYQKQYSRRNYVLRSYRWDERGQNLIAIAKRPDKGDRVVVAEGDILKIVEKEHIISGISGHGGWDATWWGIRRKYSGIIRSDIIFLLKRCGTCLSNPRKRSRAIQARDENAAQGSSNPAPGPSLPVQPFEQQLESGKGKGKGKEIADTTDRASYYDGNNQYAEYVEYDGHDDPAKYAEYAEHDEHGVYGDLGVCTEYGAFSGYGEYNEFQDENSCIDPALFLSMQDLDLYNSSNAEASGSVGHPYAYETGESSKQ
ncbi:hypothetical protein TARUN_7552 [Trichoderma arundinaceum]|uniref:Integrase zinc-binding domain-containing protein n=1 Tax=Trichoderma arundinaceum TaxID=490622 RepID=A0A395NEY0_TRIAR|nr:hypothetical protein TARUN_7552 [Trichoderma arundinaceum]